MQDALKVVEKVRRSSYLMLDGVMGYEAQIAGVGDYIPNQWLKSKVISYLKQKSVLEVKEREHIVKQYKTLVLS